METGVWLLMGFTGSTYGILEMKDSIISFTAYNQGALTHGQLKKLALSVGDETIIKHLKNGKQVKIFHFPIHMVEKIIFPWYTFGGGMNLVINSVKFRFSFLQPQNTVSFPAGKRVVQIAESISDGRRLGKEWREVLKNYTAD